jgi:hypothetical protein
MAMTAGKVTADDSGNVTKTPNDATNCAGALYDAMRDAFGADSNAALEAITDPKDKAKAKVDAAKNLAKTCNAFASWLVPYLQGNAQAKIPATAAGDDLMKDSTNANCKHPASDKFIGVV